MREVLGSFLCIVLPPVATNQPRFSWPVFLLYFAKKKKRFWWKSPASLSDLLPCRTAVRRTLQPEPSGAPAGRPSLAELTFKLLRCSSRLRYGWREVGVQRAVSVLNGNRLGPEPSGGESAAGHRSVSQKNERFFILPEWKRPPACDQTVSNFAQTCKKKARPWRKVWDERQHQANQLEVWSEDGFMFI